MSLAALALTGLLSATATISASPPPIRGVALGLFSAEEDYDYRRPLQEIAALGATDVALSVVYWQTTVRSADLRAIPGWTASDTALRRAIRAGRALGLRVMMFPILRIAEPAAGQWRGTIAPVDEDAWWHSYATLMLHLARLAQDEGATSLAIGSELVSRERSRLRWLELIDRVRLTAPRLLLAYSANWDHFRAVSFWDAVDVVGVTGYFEIAKRLDASEAEMVRAWAPIRADLERFSQELGRSIVITEVGYPSLDGGAMWPWDETRRAEVDHEEQRRAYAAFVRAWGGARFLEGVYFWNWFGDGGPSSSDYTPRAKPAAAVLGSFYGRRRER